MCLRIEVMQSAELEASRASQASSLCNKSWQLPRHLIDTKHVSRLLCMLPCADQLLCTEQSAYVTSEIVACCIRLVARGQCAALTIPVGILTCSAWPETSPQAALPTLHAARAAAQVPDSWGPACVLAAER